MYQNDKFDVPHVHLYELEKINNVQHASILWI